MKTIIQTTADRWAAQLSVGGLRRWWTLGSLTRHRDQPAAARLLAQCLQKIGTPSMSQRAGKALRRITSQPAMDAVIDCWLEDKAGETTQQVIKEQGWRHSDEARWLKFLTKRNRFDEYFVVQLAPLVNQPAAARMLAHPEAAKASNITANAVADALRHISASEAADAVIDCWLEDKAGETARLVIEERGWRHTDETPWLRFLSKRNRFDEYFVAELAPLVNQPAVARMLAHPEGAGAEKAALVAAAAALGKITAPEAMDAVIDCYLEDEAGETARQVIEKRGCQHSDEARWLKFLTRRNRFDEYFVAQLAPLVNHPAVARMLAHPEAAKASKSATEAAAAALRQISAPDAMDAMIDCWLKDDAGETVRQVIEAQGWRHSDKTNWFKFLTQRKRFDEYFVAELAPLANQPSVARMLAHPEGGNADQIAVAAVAAGLRQISAQETVDEVINCWLEDKAGETARLVIEERGWRHSDETQWLKFLNKRNRFDDYFVAELSPLVNEPETVGRLLARLGGGDASQAARLAIAAALGQIAAPDAVDAVIDCWLEDRADLAIRHGVDERGWLQCAEIPWFELFNKQKSRAGEIVRKVIEDRGWRHSEEARWFLYLAATDRFDEYLTEDYDFQTLRPEFLAASTALNPKTEVE